jgi:predicted aspartyl protease
LEGYQALSSTGRIFTTPEAGTVPLYRLISPAAQLHFYTPSFEERGEAIEEGLIDEGIAGYVYLDSSCGASPLYRLFSTITGDHFYTMNAAEINTVVKTQNYNFEGLECFIFPV